MLEGLPVEPGQSYNIWRHCHQNLMSEIEGGIQDPDIKFSALWSFSDTDGSKKKLSMISSTGNSPALADKILKHQFKIIGLLRKEYEVNWDEDENLPIERI